MALMENPTMRKVAVSTVIASLLCAAPALAWNGFGHMTVAAVAYLANLAAKWQPRMLPPSQAILKSLAARFASFAHPTSDQYITPRLTQP
jgi:hypothetical protein